MKVLHVCETIKGGIATYLTTFQHVCGDQVESLFVVPEDHAMQVDNICKIATYRGGRRSLRAIFNLVIFARQQARSFSPDIILFHSTFSLAALLLVRSMLPHAAIIYCPHGWARLRYDDHPVFARIVSLIEGMLSGIPDLVLNISNNDYFLAQRFGYKGRHIVVENALPDLKSLPVKSPFPVGNERINVLFVGRFDRQKGLDILLNAFPAASAANKSLHLHVVGASVQGDDRIDPVSTSSITFHDWMPSSRIIDYYAHADLVIIPSRWEGLPMVLIEALRTGTPVMVADSSGLGGLVEDGVSGFVVPLSVDSFVDALTSVRSERLRAMRNAARKLYESRYGSVRFKHETTAALSLAMTVGPGAARTCGEGTSAKAM